MSMSPAPGNAPFRREVARLGWVARPEFWGSLLAHAGLLLWIGWPVLRPAASPAPLEVYVVDHSPSGTMSEELAAADTPAPMPPAAAVAPPRRTPAEPGPPLSITDLPVGEGGAQPLPVLSASVAAGAAPAVEDVLATVADTALPIAAQDVASAEQAIQLRLLAHLRRHQFYPRAARRAGIEGSLRLSVRIDGEGRVLQVVITASSGHAVLDHAALSLVARAQPFPSPRVLAGIEQVDIELPLDYRLDMDALASGSP